MGFPAIQKKKNCILFNGSSLTTTTTDAEGFQGDEYYIQRVIDLAHENVRAGGRPFSTLIVNNNTGEILAEACNQVAQTGDPTRHAEIVAIQEASRKLRDRCIRVDGTNGSPGEDFKGCNFYILTDPCPMCAAAMGYCGADKIIHATTRAEYCKYYRDDRRHVSMDTFGTASKILCDVQNVQHIPDERAIGVYAAWNDRNDAKSKEGHDHCRSSADDNELGGIPIMKEIPERRPEELDEDGAEIPVWRDREELKALLSVGSDRHLDILSYRGTPTDNFFRNTRELNSMVRSHYATYVREMGMHIRPAIIASDYEVGFEGVGSTYTLYRADGSKESFSPTPKSYEMFKALSHLTLGMSSVVTPYFKCPTDQGWQAILSSFLAKIEDLLSNVQTCGMSSKVVDHVVPMLNVTREYILARLEAGSVDIQSFRQYTQDVLPYIHRCMANAARMQVEAAMPILLRWKRELGDQWKQVSVIIPTVWPVGGDNPRERLFSFLLPNPKLQIIKTENQFGEEALFTTLGRVVGDQSMAATVFGQATAAARDSMLSLSTPRDLVSSACADALLSYIQEHPERLGEICNGISAEATAGVRRWMESNPNDPSTMGGITQFHAAPITNESFGKAMSQCPFFKS